MKRGKNRDAPDWHEEGLRLLLAALRQLGGVRRGIEIANAHYGYFPIEGRIPLSPLARSLTTFLSLFLIPLATSPARSHRVLPLAFALSLLTCVSSFSPSLFFFFPALSFHLSHRTFPPQLCALSSHLFLPSRIALRFSFFPSRALFFLKSCTLILLSLSLSLSLFLLLFLAKRKRTRKNVDSRFHFLVFHSCLSL